MPKIISIATETGSFEYKQEEIFDYMLGLMPWEKDEKRKVKFLYDRSGIETRFSVLTDFQKDTKDPVLYPNQESPKIQDRMAVFNEKALPFAVNVAKKCLKNISKDKITHLITVSCTGMSAPGLDIQLLQALGLSSTIERSSVNFMGCYAGIHALKQAYHMANSQPDACVLVVCVELCTLHFQHTNDDNNTLANMLFADGAAAVLVSNDLFQSTLENELNINAFHSDILFSGNEDMSWNISETGFLMKLSSYVPKVISADIKGYYDVFLKKVNLKVSEINFWAIHPGGKAILEAVQHQMFIADNQIQPSYDILKKYGNMSSPTILFVLDNIMNYYSYKKGDKLMTTAFGPGLTIESVLLEIA